jgi:hypothetical protein
MFKKLIVIKQWILIFSIGLAIGIVVGGQTTYLSILKDCKIMGMFRHGDAPVSCTYHLITTPSEKSK